MRNLGKAFMGEGYTTQIKPRALDGKRPVLMSWRVDLEGYWDCNLHVTILLDSTWIATGKAGGL